MAHREFLRGFRSFSGFRKICPRSLSIRRLAGYREKLMSVSPLRIRGGPFLKVGGGRPEKVFGIIAEPSLPGVYFCDFFGGPYFKGTNP